MSSVAIVLAAGFAGLLVIGMPFWASLAATSLLALLISGTDIIVLAQKFVGGTQSFSLLAVPFFILAGDLMSAGGMTRRLIDIANVFVRHLPGGLGMVLVLAACLFAAISGSAAATTAAIGGVMLAEMVKRGYSLPFATALAVSAGVLGPLIPPSIAFVLWGVIAQQSIAQLFLAGTLPGLLLALGLMGISWFHGWRHGVPRQPRASGQEILSALNHGKWAMFAPVIVLGGIYGGVFTPTESAVVAVMYAFVIGVAVSRELKPRDLPPLILKSMRTTAVVMLIVAAATPFGWLIALEQLPMRLATLLSGISTEPWIVLLALNLILLAIGAVSDEVSVMIIFGSMLVAVGNKLGLDPIHFGAIVVTNFSIGMATPPFGYTMLIGMAISGLNMWTITKAFWPQFLWMVIVLMLTTYVPFISLFFRQFV